MDLRIAYAVVKWKNKFGTAWFSANVSPVSSKLRGPKGLSTHISIKLLRMD